MQPPISIDTASPIPKQRKRHKADLLTATPILPPRIARRDAPPVLYRVLGFPVSPRTLESWPVPTRLVNGKTTFDTAELLAFARSKLDAAPAIQGGRKRTPRPA